LAAKWLELLKQVATTVTRAAVLRDAGLTAGIGQFAVIQSVASSIGVDVSAINMRDAREIEHDHEICEFPKWRSDLDWKCTFSS
jgi:putative ABC transport system substrate-binding protein